MPAFFGVPLISVLLFVRVELRVPASGHHRLRTVVHGFRPTPFSVRLLVARFSDDSAVTRGTAATLLHRWGRAAAEHPGLPDVTRSLGALLASAGGQGARNEWAAFQE